MIFKWFGNLKIRTKLALGFGIIILMIAALSVFSAVTIDEIDDDYVRLAHSLMESAEGLTEQEKSDFTANAAVTQAKSNRLLLT